MEQIKNLDLKALEKRMTKTTTTEAALRDITPFIYETSSKNEKIIVKKDIKNV